jgi:hypothetical protein
MNSQNKQILSYLQKGGKITPLQALNKFGCFRLASRISDLCKDGHVIDRKMVVRNGKRVAQYWIEKK